MTKNKHTKKASILIDWLDKSYHFNNDFGYKLFISVAMGILSTLFLITFEPVPVNTLKITSGLLQHAIFVGGVVLFVLLVYYFVLFSLFPSFFNPKSWTIGKQLVSIFCMVIFGSIIFWTYIHKIADESAFEGKKSFKNTVYYVLSAGFIPLVTYLLIDDRYARYRKGKRKNVKEKKEEKRNILKKKNPTTTFVTVFSYNKKENIKINTTKLIYITSESNYASFFVIKKNKIRELIIRKPLVEVEKDFANFDHIIRFHKSYIVNANYVTNILGNAHKYELEISYNNTKIPVSRKFSKEQLEELIY